MNPNLKVWELRPDAAHACCTGRASTSPLIPYRFSAVMKKLYGKLGQKGLLENSPACVLAWIKIVSVPTFSR